MEETKTHAAEKSTGQPVIHRVCEACNNMFATHAGSQERRCPKCRKD